VRGEVRFGTTSPWIAKDKDSIASVIVAGGGCCWVGFEGFAEFG
jgi:hypothetical protein